MRHPSSRAGRRLLAAILAIGAIVPLPRSAAESSRSGPNVLFLICDDLNCDLGAYGHPQVKSPNIDALAARGVRFERAYCQFPLCGPSRASFMTGLHPDQTLVLRNAVYLRERVPDVVTLPQLFRRSGYLAARVGKIYHYNVPRHIGTSGHDDPDSWDATFNPRGRDVDDEDRIFSLVPGTFGGTLSWLAADGDDAEQTDAIGADLAIAQLEKFAGTRRPFFLAVGLYRPHTPYVAPRKYFDLYPLDEIAVPTEPEGYLDSLPAPARQSIRRKKDQVDLPDDLARQAIQAYHASITFADAQVGRILDALESTGLADDTIVLFTSDHGYHMGEHGHWQKSTLFENAARVPLIIAGPGVAAKGRSTSCLAEMTDFYPTIAALAGLEAKAPDYLQGVSLVPVLANPEARPREDALTHYANGYSLRTERYRYSEWGEAGAEGSELYDHESDPAEMVNLAGLAEHAGTLKRLSARLRERVAAARAKPDGVTQIVYENVRRVR